jgi:hypothetical protein
MKKFFATLIFTLSLGFGSQLIAQPPDPGGGSGGGKPSCFPPPCVPIDGGLSFLILAGAAFGSKKIYDLKQGEEKH